MQDEKIIAMDFSGMTLQDLFNICLKQKKMIFIITLICVVVSTFYLIIVEPTYEAKAYIVPPTLTDIEMLNIGRSDDSPVKIVKDKGVYKMNIGHSDDSPLKTVNVERVYKIFSDTLLSESLHKYFFKNIYFPSLAIKKKSKRWQILHSNYLKSVAVKFTPGMVDKITITTQANSQARANYFLHQYIVIAKRKAELKIIAILSTENKLLALSIKNRIDFAKSEAKTSRSNRVVQLKEALVIAEKAGIKDPTGNNSIASDAIPMLFMHGSKALSAEIDVLQSRKSDEPFIGNLLQLVNEYNFYNNIIFSSDTFKMYRLDGPMDTSEHQISPRVVLTLIGSIFLGLMLGGGIALIRNRFMKN